MRLCTYTVIASLATVGCAAEHAGSPSVERQGRAELRVDAAAFQAADITSVLVDVDGHVALGLSFNPVSGAFEGSLALPTGVQSIRARAFSGGAQVGESRDTLVNVRPGAVTRVVLRIADLTLPMPRFGPVFDSLTYPTAVHAREPAAFTLSAIVPDHSLPTYQWSSDCADAVFTAADAAVTSWTKPIDGSCQITVIATANDFSIEQSFTITVLPEEFGDLAFTAEFITGPVASFELDGGACRVFSGDQVSNASCQRTVTAPASLGFVLNVVDWGRSTPDGFALTDDCGGQFVTASQTSDVIRGTWTPPRDGGVCILTAQAANGDGASTWLSIGLLTRPAGE